jgi:hypothetical protein
MTDQSDDEDAWEWTDSESEQTYSGGDADEESASAASPSESDASAHDEDRLDSLDVINDSDGAAFVDDAAAILPARVLDIDKALRVARGLPTASASAEGTHGERDDDGSGVVLEPPTRAAEPRQEGRAQLMDNAASDERTDEAGAAAVQDSSAAALGPCIVALFPGPDAAFVCCVETVDK